MEGGRFPWRAQKVVTRGPVGEYSHMTLPDPPAGMKWIETPDSAEKIQLVPVDDNHSTHTAHEWELLSGKHSQSQKSASDSTGSAVIIAAPASVRSFSTSHHTKSSRIPRTASDSTIDSNDIAGVLGVDFVEHVVLPGDTLQGICLRYKINPTKLRQANRFSGTNLHLAPKRLIIPLTSSNKAHSIRIQDMESKDCKIHSFLAEYPRLNATEAKAYLELADWKLMEAIASAREDQEWENDVAGGRKANTSSGGQICFKKGKNGAWRAMGAGIIPKIVREGEEEDEVVVQREDGGATAEWSTKGGCGQ